MSLTARIASHPRRTLAAALLALVLAIVLGSPVFGALEEGDSFTARDAESARALSAVEAATGAEAAPGVIALVKPAVGVDSSQGRAEIAEVSQRLAAVPGIASVQGGAVPQTTAADGSSAYVAGTLRAGADEEEMLSALERSLGDEPGVTLGGAAVAQDQLGTQISEDLGRAEMFAFPILLVLCVLFFGGFRAAALPLGVGITTIFATFLALRVINEATTLSIFALNLVIGLGLGLAIDYTLFLLTRYREELERHGAGPEAIRATMATAGRTVLFSAVTVAIAMAALIAFPLPFIQSMGIGGAAVSLIAAAAACVISPALFALWGPKLARRGGDGRGERRWHAVATRVMRRPGAVALVTMVALAAVALPALRAHWTPVDTSSVPAGLSARTVGDTLQRDYPQDRSEPITIAVGGGASDAGTVRALARAVAAEPGVASVAPPRALDGSTWQIDAVATGTAADETAQQAVQEIRALDTGGLDVRVGGPAAEFVDQQASITDRLPLALGLLALLTFVVLWAMTGSVVLPIKALVMNVLTVGSTLGILTVVFQDGRLEGLLGYTSNGGIEPTDFLVTATLVFALSTDYGVFLLGRIKEARDRGLGEREAVAVGLSQTGSVVTAAAILMAVAIGAFTTSEVSFIKQIGLATALGVLIDAFVIRGLLVPALMALLGSWNWWSPAPLRRLHERLGSLEGPTQPRGGEVLAGR